MTFGYLFLPTMFKYIMQDTKKKLKFTCLEFLSFEDLKLRDT